MLKTYKGNVCLTIEDEYEEIPMEHILITAKSGSGKSIASEGIVEKLHKKGFTIFCITDVKDEFETAFCIFKPEKKYHITNIKKQLGKEILEPSDFNTKQIQIYHPFTFNIPKYPIPEIKFFTIPIKNLNRELIQIWFETDSERQSIRTILQSIEEIKKNEGLHDLLYKIRKNSTTKIDKKNEISIGNADSLWMDTTTGGNIKTLAELTGFLKPFIQDYIFTPENCKLNLDFDEIFTNKEQRQKYHILSYKWIKDRKIKDFTTICFLDSLLNYLDKNEEKIKNPICILIEEIRFLAPNSAKGYKHYLAEYLAKKLAIVRAKAKGISTIMTTQIYQDVNEVIRNSATINLLGQIESLSEIDRISKSLKLKRPDLLQIRNLQKGEYMFLKENDYGSFTLRVPTHCHKEIDYNFIEMYRKIYPEKMQTYQEITDYIKEIKEEIENKIKEKIMKEKKEMVKIKKEKVEEKIAQKNMQKIAKEKIEQSKQKINEITQQLENLIYQDYKEGLSYSEIATKHNLFLNNGKPNKMKVARAIKKISQNQEKENESQTT